MLRNLSLAIAAFGFILFVAVLGLVVDNPQHGHYLMWPMMLAVWSVAIGMQMARIARRRHRQRKLLQQVFVGIGRD